jgi:hypothetical protein
MELKKVLGLLQDAEPVLQNPEKLTDEIMLQIKLMPQGKPVSRMLIMERILVAASIALLLIFGYEQTVMVRDMESLESQMSNVHEYSQLQNINHLQDAVTRLNAGLSFTEIEQLLSARRSYLHPKQSSGSRVDEVIKKQRK